MDNILYKATIPSFPGPDRFFWDLVLNILCLGYDEPIAITQQVAPGRATVPLFLPRETFSSFHWGHD
jgi:hypothetical protein